MGGAFGFANNFFSVDSDTAVIGTDEPMAAFEYNQTYGGSGMTGDRYTMVVHNIQQGISANGLGFAGHYSALVTSTYTNTGDGGTGLTRATSAGYYYGENPVVYIDSGARNVAEAVGSEIDTYIMSGATTMYSIGANIVALGDVQGVVHDAAVSIGSGGAASWKCGVCWSDINTRSPVGATSTLIGYYWSTIGTQTITNGIDLRGFAFTGYAMVGGNFAINGSGSIWAGDITDSSSTSTGALVSSGGLGVAKKAYIGTSVTVPKVESTGTLLLNGAGGTGALQAAGTAYAFWNNSGLYPQTDNGWSLGGTGDRFTAIYGVTFYGGANVAGVSCAGTPTAAFTSAGGIVTHC
jgi:hypothetical protein